MNRYRSLTPPLVYIYSPNLLCFLFGIHSTHLFELFLSLVNLYVFPGLSFKPNKKLQLGMKVMEVGQLQRKLADLTASLYHEGILDDQFAQLQQLQDESNPDFVYEVVTLFFDDSEKLLDELGKTLDQPVVDFKKVDAHVHQLKGSSSSIGAQRVKNVCITFRNLCEQNNREGCVLCLQQVKHEYALIKGKLESLFRLEQQIISAGGSLSMME